MWLIKPLNKGCRTINSETYKLKFNLEKIQLKAFLLQRKEEQVQRLWNIQKSKSIVLSNLWIKGIIEHLLWSNYAQSVTPMIILLSKLCRDLLSYHPSTFKVYLMKAQLSNWSLLILQLLSLTNPYNLLIYH